MLRRRSATQLLLVAVAVGGCTAQETNGRQDQVAVTGTAVPLAAYLNRSAKDRFTIALGEHIFIGRCMVQRGFDVYEPPPSIEEYTSNRYGVLDPERVAKYGYHLPPQVRSADNFSPVMSDTERGLYFEARNGRLGENPVEITDDSGVTVSYDRGGCLGQWDEYVFGEFARYESLRLTLDRWQSESLSRALASPDVQSAVTRWRQCMDEIGYRYDNLSGPSEQFGGEEEVSQLELKVAAADLDCRLSSGYSESVRRRDIAEQQLLLEGNPSLVDEYAEVWAEAVRRAAELVASDD